MSGNTLRSVPPAANGDLDLGGPVERRHASDQVFRELAGAILRRELEPGSALPPERQLSDRFGVSRIVVREAIHRLKEYELVRVRQGSPTVVLDPDEATDIRLLGLEIDLAPDVQALSDRQSYSAAALLDLAEQRMTDSEIDAIESLVHAFIADAERDQRWLHFERAYWLAIARGTRNRVLVRETVWFFNLLQREPRFHTAILGSVLPRAQLYGYIAQNLRKRAGSAALFLKSLRSLVAPPNDAEAAG